ncbi:MAG: type IV toxin-antitoxin system AbiEi family antitoxin domain-containing protein [Actinomycetota bacterium]
MSVVEIDRRLDEFAARQYGVVNRAQALSVGMSDEMIRRRIRSGRWVKLGTGVYAYSSAPPKWERQVAAAVLSQPRAHVGGRAAAYLHGFDGFRPSRPELVAPPTANARSALARIIRDSHFDEIRTTRVRGFAVTSVAETLWTLARSLSQEELERLLDSQLTAKRVAVAAFDPILERIDGERRPGGPRLRSVLADRRLDAFQPATSQLESHLYPLLDSPGVPPYTRQCPISLDEHIEAVLDAYIPTWRMIVEADGRRWHTRQADFERDRRRDNAAAAMGFLVIRFSYRMLVDEPAYCLRTLQEAGQRRTGLRV